MTPSALLQLLVAARERLGRSWPLMALALPTQVLSLALAGLGYALGARPPGLGCDAPWPMVLAVLIAGEITVIVGLAVLKPFFGEIKLPGFMEVLLEALKRSHPADLALTCALVGFTEELLFRGILTTWLSPIPCALVFAAAHRPRVALHWLSLSGLGFLFDYEMRMTGGLLVPMVHHAFHDLGALAMLSVVLANHPPETE